MTFVSSIFQIISSFIMNVISSLGYFGIVLLMAIESMLIPLPSEIIMPFAGFLAFQHRFSLVLVALAGAIGNVIGSLIAYYAGYYGGRPFVIKYGKYFLIHHKELENSEKWFKKYGSSASFFSRLLPVIRTFISLPAGIAKTNIKKFVLYTFLGSFIWAYFLAFIGFKLGQNWNAIEIYFRKFDFVLAIILAILLFLFIRRHLKNSNKKLVDKTKINQ